MTIQHRFRLFIGVGLLALLCVAGASRSFAMDARADLSLADVAARVKNSVVTVAAAVVALYSLAGSNPPNTKVRLRPL